MKATWIIVADNTRARFFTAATPSSALVEVEGLGHGEGRLHDREITTDMPGRIKSSDGSGHALQQATDPKHHEFDKFAHEVAQLLEDGLNDHQYVNLLIIAEPSFLGLLRQHFSDQVKQHITFELAKNMTLQSLDEIRKHLPDYLPNEL